MVKLMDQNNILVLKKGIVEKEVEWNCNKKNGKKKHRMEPINSISLGPNYMAFISFWNVLK